MWETVFPGADVTEGGRDRKPPVLSTHLSAKGGRRIHSYSPVPIPGPSPWLSYWLFEE